MFMEGGGGGKVVKIQYLPVAGNEDPFSMLSPIPSRFLKTRSDLNLNTGTGLCCWEKVDFCTTGAGAGLISAARLQSPEAF